MKSLNRESRPEPKNGTFRIDSSVEIIEAGCFSGCKSLEEVIFADVSKLGRIGKSAFKESGLKGITIPSEVELGSDAFPSYCAVCRTPVPLKQAKKILEETEAEANEFEEETIEDNSEGVERKHSESSVYYKNSTDQVNSGAQLKYGDCVYYYYLPLLFIIIPCLYYLL